MKSIRAVCCGKKRKPSQLNFIETYDGSVWKCKQGYGCKKVQPKE